MVHGLDGHFVTLLLQRQLRNDGASMIFYPRLEKFAEVQAVKPTPLIKLIFAGDSLSKVPLSLRLALSL